MHIISLGDYVFPEIHNAWNCCQREMLGKITKECRQVELSIDGQCDTPGHNATYCTVSSMNIHTNKIIDFNVVDVKEVRNSQG